MRALDVQILKSCGTVEIIHRNGRVWVCNYKTNIDTGERKKN